MLRKISVSLLALSVAGFAGSAMAVTVPVNPWAPAQTTVPVTVTVQAMTELYTDTTPVGLSIVDAGENQNSAQAVARILHHLHNVGVDVSASLSADIPNNTQFFILIDPASSWADRTSSAASTTLAWRREGGVYSAASGGFPNTLSATSAGSPLLAFSAASNAGHTGADPEAVKNIQYFADAENVMPDTGATTFNVVWTIAPSP